MRILLKFGFSIGIVMIVAFAAFHWAMEPACACAKVECRVHLLYIQKAKVEWAAEQNSAINVEPAWEDLIGPGRRLQLQPDCPDGGHYSVNPLGTAPTCSKGKNPTYSLTSTLPWKP